VKKQSAFVVVLITAKNMQDARKISRTLLNEKLAACVNIVKGVESMFWWEGKVDQVSEALLVVKTKKSILRKLIKVVKSVHSYTVPEIIALPILDGNPDYLKWVNESVKR
jgi:periplasmic divalent cation tolerance protein